MVVGTEAEVVELPSAMDSSSCFDVGAAASFADADSAACGCCGDVGDVDDGG